MRSANRLRGVFLGLVFGLWACAADAAELVLVNNSLKAIRQLYVVPAGGKDWGPDLLGLQPPSVIAPGDRRTITELAPAIYDLRLIDEDGSECEITAIEVETSIKVELTDTQLADCTSSH
jgi:hypothetical protein